MPKISIIVPIYNGAKFIKSCIAGLFNQSIVDKEIILIDDGSTDDTFSILNNIKKPNVYIVSQENAGAGVARNIGIEHAHGEYIAFLDVDDKYASNESLELLYNCAKNNNADVCGGSLLIEKDQVNNDKRIFEKDGFWDFKDYQYDFGFNQYIYKRQFLMDSGIRFPNYRIYEDPVFLLQVMVSAQKFYAVSEPVYVYSGAHQTSLNAKKTIDYLHGLRDNLIVSANYKYGELHKVLFERLNNTASYYVEKNMDTEDYLLYEALIAASNSVDKNLLRSVGVVVSDEYLVPALQTVWKASSTYMKLRKKIFFWERLKRR